METFNQLSKSAQKELKNYLIDGIKNHIGTHCEELHNNLFNIDYYIIGTYEAGKWLDKHIGAFNAIDIVRDYEEFNFGKFVTEIQEEKILNMLTYIVGEELINSLPSFDRDLILTDKLAKQLIKEVKAL